MTTKGKSHFNALKGFSLFELIIVIAVIAAMGTVIVPTILNFRDAGEKNSEKRNIQLWNTAYLQLISADPSYKTKSWNEIKQVLSDGFSFNLGAQSYTIQAATPTFKNESSLEFTPGTGITNAP